MSDHTKGTHSAMSNAAAEYLRQVEWQMGNGQCPECGGNRPGGWAPHPCVPSAEHEGHTPACPLAAGLVSVGQPVTFCSQFKYDEDHALREIEARRRKRRQQWVEPVVVTPE